MQAGSELDPALARLLESLAAELAACSRPWWLIGSAAMAVHGAPVRVGDVDLLLNPEDAPAVLARRGLPARAGTPSSRFASDLFTAWEAPPFRVEVFAGFRVKPAGSGTWQAMRPRTREARRIGSAKLFVPSVSELIEWGRLFGRPKDVEREALLRALPAEA